MVQWYADLAATLDEVWQRLGRGVADAKSAARHPTLATIGPDEAPRLRTCVLRAASRTGAHLDVHSDVRAGKIDEIRARPRVSLHVWDARANLQLRLGGAAAILTGDAVADIWRAVPTKARSNYGGAPAPATPLDDPSDHDAEIDPGCFAVVRTTLDAIETLHLGQDRHRRAVFEAATGWRGRWLAP